MPRKQHEQSDSLEMLLDTMCNAFGGLILIAIMIALLAKPPTPKGGDPDAEIVKIKIAVKEPHLIDLTKELDILAEMAQAIDPAVTNLVVQKNDLSLKIATAKNTMANLATTPEEKTKLEQKLSAQQLMNDQKIKELADTKRQVAQVEASLNQANKGKPVTVRAPRNRGTRKKEAFIFVKDGKFWAADIWVNGIREDNQRSCRIIKDARGKNQKQVPIDNRGVQIFKNEVALANSPIGAYIRMFPKGDFYTSIQVSKDSFSEFRILKEYLIRNGIDYNWQPRDEDKMAVFYTTGPVTNIGVQ